MRRAGAALLALALLGAGAEARAEERPGMADGRISVVGRARSEVAPDFAAVEIGVEAKGATPAAALDGASAAAGAILALAADLAIPLGLFVNELVTNAIKYAYADGEGEIRVEAQPDDAGGLILGVQDDGAGLPAGFDPTAARSASLGMRIINSLARQLGGALQVAPDVRGAHFSLRVAPLV